MEREIRAGVLEQVVVEELPVHSAHRISPSPLYQRGEKAWEKNSPFGKGGQRGI
jgi:hypothetical protein